MTTTLTFANQTGVFSTTPGSYGVMSAAGMFGPQCRMNVFFRQSSSGQWAGIDQFRGIFSESIQFPGTDLKFELWQPLNITQVDVDVTAAP